MGTTMEKRRIGQEIELPRVTFLIAHHNYQEYLGKCIESALAQTYPNIKICIIDDCSNDRQSVEDIVEKFDKPCSCTEDKNFVINSGWKIVTIYITDHPRGPSYTRNRGIEHMWNDTDIFAVLDADDENYPTKIEKCVKPFIQYPTEVGVVYADHFTFNTTTELGRVEYREPFDVYRLNQECIVHSGSLISKLALEHTKEVAGYYDETMRTCEDYDLWMRIAEKFMIVHIAEPLSFVRVQPKNSTDTVAKQIWNANYQRVFQKRQIRQNGL
jgi:glycosyltransferase involved in cell wall biosynthesis